MVVALKKPNFDFRHRNLLGIEGLSAEEINLLLDRSDHYAERNRRASKPGTTLRGRTVINLFFENSTRTRHIVSVGGAAPRADVVTCRSSTVRSRKAKRFSIPRLP